MYKGKLAGGWGASVTREGLSGKEPSHKGSLSVVMPCGIAKFVRKKDNRQYFNPLISSRPLIGQFFVYLQIEMPLSVL